MVLDQAASDLLGISRGAKRLVVVSIDTAFCCVAVWLAFDLRLESWGSFNVDMAFASAASVVIALPLFVAVRLYRAIFRYSDIDALFSIFKSLTIYAFVFFGIVTLVGTLSVLSTVGIFSPLCSQCLC